VKKSRNLIEAVQDLPHLMSINLWRIDNLYSSSTMDTKDHLNRTIPSIACIIRQYLTPAAKPIISTDSLLTM
jgi:hypothetical protein